MPSGGDRRRAPKTAVVGLALALALSATACSAIGAAGAEPEPTPTQSPIPAPEPLISVVAVGDSLATGDGNDSTPADPGSWRQYLTGGMAVTDGWWRNGATTTLMADNLELTRGDVLVIMGGTNDAAEDIPVFKTASAVKRIVQKVETDTVILCAIPPFPRDPEGAAAINEKLEALALESGWFWLDPWELYRDGDDWTGDASLDGVHPNEPVYRGAGTVIAQTIHGIVG
jgi:lysophospholipase L1-like esterase